MATTDALWCVVPAAGRGARVGGEVPKQYLPIAGKPMLLHTLERLAAHPRIAGLMVVLASDDLDGDFAKIAQHDGVEIVEEPTEQPYGARDCSLRDPAGNMIKIQQTR